MGHYVEADDEEETRPSAAVPPSVRGSTRTPTVAIHDRGITTTSPSPSLAPFACPVAATPTTADARGVKTETVSPPPERSPRGVHAAPCPAAAAPPPAPAPRRRAAREARFPVGSARPLHRRAAAKMSPRIRTGPEAVLAAHAPPPSAAAATARRKAGSAPHTGTEFFFKLLNLLKEFETK